MSIQNMLFGMLGQYLYSVLFKEDTKYPLQPEDKTRFSRNKLNL